MDSRKKPKTRIPLAWRPHASQEKFEGERTEKLLSDLRVENVQGAAVDCADCVALQQKSGDPTTLCRPHLQKALGL